MNLNNLAIKHGSDKREDIHDYARLYQNYFESRRMEKLTILEIGVFGGASLKMWRDYFPNATIVGVDINPDSMVYAEKRVSIEIGDQSDAGFLIALGVKYGHFDIIIDDGSHATAHHKASFDILKEWVKPNGFYIIEDLHTCYWPTYNQGYNSIDGVLVPLVHAGQMHGRSGYGNPYGPASRADLGQYGFNDLTQNTGLYDTYWEFIHFYKSIVFIKKR